MSRKKIVVVVFTLLCLLSLAIATSFLSPSKKQRPQTQNPTLTMSGTPVSTQQPQQIQPLRIIKTDPVNNQTNIPLDQKITISFNNPFSLSHIIFSINPSVTYTTAINGNDLVITPYATYSTGTTYNYSIQFVGTQSMQTFSFTTTALVVTSPDDTSQVADTFNKTHYPDVFVYNRMPFQTTDFSATGSFTSSPTEHYYTTVALNQTNPDQSKQAFVNWLKSLGLTDDQIQILDIRYQ